MVKYIAAILLLLDMVLGLYIWLEDHDDKRLRVIRLGSIVFFALVLLLAIFLSA